jgi:hypothetical protein
MEQPADTVNSTLNRATFCHTEIASAHEIQSERLNQAFRDFEHMGLSFLSQWKFPAAFSAEDAYQNACTKMWRRFAGSDLVIGEAPEYRIASTSMNVKFSTYFYPVLRSAANDIMRSRSSKTETMDFGAGSSWISPRAQNLSRTHLSDPVPRGRLAARRLAPVDDPREHEEGGVATVAATLATVLASADMRRDAGASTSAIALLLAQIACNPELQEIFPPEGGTKALVDAVRSILPSIYGDATEGAILRAINRTRERLRGLLLTQQEVQQ